MANIALFLVLAIVAVVQGQKVSLGSCPEVSGIASFDAAAYLGTWYQISKYPSVFEAGQCITAEYTLAADNSTVDVKNSQKLLGVFSNSIEGTAAVSSDDGSGQLDVTFTFLSNLVKQTATLYILDTDYTDYAINYSCTNLGLFKAENVWILSRTRELSATGSTAVESYLAANSDLIDESSLEAQDQSEETCASE